VPHAVIVKEAGVSLSALKKRVVRERWKVARTEACEIVSQQGIQQKSELIKHAIADEIVSDLDVVRERPSRNLKDAERKQNLLHTMAGTAERVCGWNNGGHQTSILNIEHLTAPAQWVEPAQTPDREPEFCVEHVDGKAIEIPYREWLERHEANGGLHEQIASAVPRQHDTGGAQSVLEGSGGAGDAALEIE
jgi:hypothetical protein